VPVTNPKFYEPWSNVPGLFRSRLTLSATDPAPAADVVGASAATLYLVPATNYLTDGNNFVVFTADSLSVSLSGIAAGSLYDVFLTGAAGTPALELAAYSRPLGTLGNVLTKPGDNSRRYLGTIRGQSAGQCEDSALRRFVWNFHNRVRRQLLRQESAGSWTDTTVGYRQANLSTANMVELVAGLPASLLDLWCFVTGSTAGGAVNVRGNIGEDNTTPVADFRPCMDPVTAGYAGMSMARLTKVPAQGYHFYTWLEYMGASGTVTFTGSNFSGLSGVWEC